MKNGNQGITLVALVITIIVLIILAGVSINSVMNEGLIANSKQAKESHEKGQREEKVDIDKLEAEMHSAMYEDGDNTEVTLTENGTSKTSTFKQITIGDEEGLNNAVYENSIPADAKVITLNKKVYTDSGIAVAATQSIIIDLNGYEIVYTGKGLLFRGSGEVYIKDSSTNKTGKIVMTEEPPEYVEMCDVNKDGHVNADDNTFFEAAYDKTSADEDWALYKHCDYDDNKVIELEDLTAFQVAYEQTCKHVFNKSIKLYADIGENALVTPCGHQK